MDNSRPEDILILPAKIISIIFHPLFMPLYGMFIVFSAPTLFGYLPFTVKRLLILLVFINNVLLPLSLLPYLRYRNHITSWSIDNRKERLLPLFIATILYAATSYIILRFPIPVFLKTFVLGAFFLSFTITIINFRWKISIHSAGAGAITALVLVLSFKMNSPLIWPLMMVIISAGLVMSSRLKLNAHTPSEVWSGYFIGNLGLGLIMWYF